MTTVQNFETTSKETQEVNKGFKAKTTLKFLILLILCDVLFEAL